jgi:Zn-finger nucleic acid-binding protein
LPYLNCPNCRLTVYASTMYSLRDECPRCAAKLGRVSRLFRSDLPHRLMERMEKTVPGKREPESPSA